MRINNTINVLKFRTHFFPFSNEMLVIKAGIHKILLRIANRKEPDQTVFQKKPSDLDLNHLSRPFWQPTGI